MAKKVPIDDGIQAIIQQTHQEMKPTKSGMTKKSAQGLSVEAQLLMFAEKIDQGVLTTLKSTGTSFRFMREKLWEAEKSNGQGFDPQFLEKIASALI